MPKPDIMQLLFSLNNNIIECRRELAKMKRILREFTSIKSEVELSPPDNPPEIMITEEVYDKLCEYLEEEEMDKMGVT